MQGITLAEHFWLRLFREHVSRPFANLKGNAMLDEARGTLSLSPAHHIILNNAHVEIAAYLRMYPIAVLHEDSYGFTLLHWAVWAAELETMKPVLDAGANVHATCHRGRTALMWAVDSLMAADICHLLIDQGADAKAVSNRSDNALMRALDFGPTPEATIEVLLHAGTNLKHINAGHFTALDAAALLASPRACPTHIAWRSAGLSERLRVDLFHVPHA
ncbi:ankyrin [Macroventuria anomochaeta]|uniref:Ankyrin n=1 Tax=Macroventuria anomochaeta TaxID=301207 RepID=A0ACB6RTL3_9PLEO|nr:ankyrin [Macroventuria anomochaeta]KAF2624479.1 ankyrin [Macroventuria anomochaeta]